MKNLLLRIGLSSLCVLSTSCKTRPVSSLKMGPPNAITDAEFPSVLPLVRQGTMLNNDPSLFSPTPENIRLDDFENCFATILSSSVLITAAHCYAETLPPLVVTINEVIEPEFTISIKTLGENLPFSDVRLLVFSGEPFKKYPTITIFNLKDEIKAPMSVVGHGRPFFQDKDSMVSKMPNIPRSKGRIIEYRVATKGIAGYEGQAIVSIKTSTNATMAPADSGGPMFSDGKLVGVLSQKALSHFSEMFPGELAADVWTILDSKWAKQFLSEAVYLNANLPGVAAVEKCCVLAKKVSYVEGKSERAEIRKKFEVKLIEQRRYRFSDEYAAEVDRLQRSYLDQKLIDRYRKETRAVLQAKLVKIISEQSDKFTLSPSVRRPVVSSIYANISFSHLSTIDLSDNLQSLLMQDLNYYFSEVNFALREKVASKGNLFIRTGIADPKALMETSADLYEDIDSDDLRVKALASLDLDAAVGLLISLPTFDEFFQKKKEPEITAVWLWTQKEAKRIY